MKMKNVTYSKFCVLVEPCLGRKGILLLILLGLVWWLLKLGEVGVDNLLTASTVVAADSINKLGFEVGGFTKVGNAGRETEFMKCCMVANANNNPMVSTTTLKSMVNA